MYYNLSQFNNGQNNQLQLTLKLNKLKKMGKKIVGCGYPFQVEELKALVNICDYFIDYENNTNTYFSRNSVIKPYEFYIQNDLKNSVILSFLPSNINLIQTLIKNGLSEENIFYTKEKPKELIINVDNAIQSQDFSLYAFETDYLKITHGINVFGKCALFMSGRGIIDLGYIEMSSDAIMYLNSKNNTKILNLYMEKDSLLSLGYNGKLTIDSMYLSRYSKVCVYTGQADIGHVYIGQNSIIHIYSKLHIGNECWISWNVSILDGDGHNLKHKDFDNKPEPIIINDKVWIGNNSVILKGVEIGEGSVVGSGSVVTRSVPPNCLVVGNPARIIKENITWDYKYDYLN